MISFVISACIIWFLLVLFNEGNNYEIQQHQAITITLVVTLVGLLINLAVSFYLPPGFWIVALLGRVAVLYVAVDTFCGYSSRTTWKIVVSFFGLLMIWGMLDAFLF